MASGIVSREHALCPPQQAACPTRDEAWALDEVNAEYDWDQAFEQLTGTSGYVDRVQNEVTQVRYQADEHNTGTLSLARVRIGHATDDDYRVEIGSGESGGLVYKVTNTATGAVSEPKPFESGAWVQIDDHYMLLEGRSVSGDKFDIIVDHHPLREERVWIEDLAPVRLKAKVELFLELFDPHLENDVDADPVWKLLPAWPDAGTSVDSTSVPQAGQPTLPA
jgi:hypothetical protein